LGDHIGRLNHLRIRQVLDGVHFLTDPREAE
jgi:hypothetical protein